MFMKLLIFLLLANFAATASIGYTVHKNSQRKPYLLEIETPVEDEEFKENMYKAMGMIMSGQSQLASNQEGINMAIYRIHHFVKPHVEFHPNCPECEIDKQKILEEEKESVTSLEAG